MSLKCELDEEELGNAAALKGTYISKWKEFFEEPLHRFPPFSPTFHITVTAYF